MVDFGMAWNWCVHPSIFRLLAPWWQWIQAQIQWISTAAASKSSGEDESMPSMPDVNDSSGNVTDNMWICILLQVYQVLHRRDKHLSSLRHICHRPAAYQNIFGSQVKCIWSTRHWRQCMDRLWSCPVFPSSDCSWNDGSTHCKRKKGLPVPFHCQW